MKPVRYVLKAGDTLWSIAGTHYDDPGRWPDLYAYNNRPDIVAQTERPIVNPDRMVPGQAIFLPPPQTRTTQRRAPSARATDPLRAVGAGGMPKPGGTAIAPASSRGLPSMGAGGGGAAFGAASLSRNPAAETQVNDFAHVFQLAGEAMAVRGPDFSAALHVYGMITLQRTARVPLVGYSSRSADTQARSQSAMLLGQLLSTQGTQLGWNPQGNQIAYEATLTRKAGIRSPAAGLGQGVSERGRPVLKASLAIPDFSGRVASHVYIARDFVVVVELTPGQSVAPTRQPAPSSEHRGERANWLWAAAIGQSSTLVVGAVLDESAVTPGNGLADCAPTLAGGVAGRRGGASATQFVNALPTPVRIGDTVRRSA